MNTEDLHRNMIAFGEWLLQNYWIMAYPDGHVWVHNNNIKSGEYTTEELFQIYLKEISNDIKTEDYSR